MVSMDDPNAMKTPSLPGSRCANYISKPGSRLMVLHYGLRSMQLLAVRPDKQTVKSASSGRVFDPKHSWRSAYRFSAPCNIYQRNEKSISGGMANLHTASLKSFYGLLTMTSNCYGFLFTIYIISYILYMYMICKHLCGVFLILLKSRQYRHLFPRWQPLHLRNQGN